MVGGSSTLAGQVKVWVKVPQRIEAMGAREMTCVLEELRAMIFVSEERSCAGEGVEQVEVQGRGQNPPVSENLRAFG